MINILCQSVFVYLPHTRIFYHPEVVFNASNKWFAVSPLWVSLVWLGQQFFSLWFDLIIFNIISTRYSINFEIKTSFLFDFRFQNCCSKSGRGERCELTIFVFSPVLNLVSNDEYSTFSRKLYVRKPYFFVNWDETCVCLIFFLSFFLLFFLYLLKWVENIVIVKRKGAIIKKKSLFTHFFWLFTGIMRFNVDCCGKTLIFLTFTVIFLYLVRWTLINFCVGISSLPLSFLLSTWNRRIFPIFCFSSVSFLSSRLIWFHCE